MRARFGVSAFAALAFLGSTGSAEVLSCERIPLSVSAPSMVLAERACQAAERILPAFAECGVVVTQPLNITLRDSIPGMPSCMGVYHCSTDAIEVLTPDAVARFRRQDSAFKAISNAVYFDSILAHELSHAAYDLVFCPFSDCVVTSEYVAYAMQIYTLPRSSQKDFEGNVELEKRVSRYDISHIGLLMAPDDFARKVWAHCIRPAPQRLTPIAVSSSRGRVRRYG